MTEAAGDPAAYLSPIVCTQQVDRAPAEAFAAFTQDLGAWWDPRLTAEPSSFQDAVVEPRPGGSVRFLHDGPMAYELATVTSWRPPEQLGLRFWLALDPDHPTTLTVDFVPMAGGGTLVSLAHGGWTEHNGPHRRKFTEWPALLARYAAHVARQDA